MIIKGLTEVVSTEVLFSFLAASGGIARIVAIKSDGNGNSQFSLGGEILRIIFVAMPVGILAGMYVKGACDAPVLPYATTFSAGVLSLSLVRFILSAEGLKAMNTVLLRIIGGGTK